MDTTDNLGLPYLLPSQAQKHVTHNEALGMLDALVQLSVADRDLAEPPPAPDAGARYIVAAGAGGAWSGQDGRIAHFHDGAWSFHAPKPGFLCHVADEAAFLHWTGSAWAELSQSISALQSLALLGIGTTADAANPFSAKLNKALWTARTAAEGGDGDLRYTMNKEGAADVLSLLMQTNWSGRVELGLIGDDDLSVKVSADGSSWREALRIDGATGLATFAPTGSLAHAVRGLFEKADGSSVVFTKTGAGTIDLKAGTIVELGGFLHVFATSTAVQMPTLAAGTDYAIHVCNDGTVRADANFSAPTGFDASTSRRIGGFHHAPGGNAAGTTGGDTTPAINEYSLWDLKWRPACPDPRGMALVAGAFWCDIYLLGVNHHTDGTSRNNVTIANGSSPPKIPDAFGGNGSAAYSSLTWFEASEVMTSHGKSLLDYTEFAAMAYGATENQSRGNDPVTTGLGTTNSGSSNTDEKQTSKWGIVQAMGCLWTWGRDLQYYAAGADIAALIAFGYKNQTASRGRIYTQNTTGISTVLFGGGYDFGGNSGSRASYWARAPWYSGGGIGTRGRSDHLCHR